jgi:spermidine/putrescine transport system ATP-binding protein
MNVVSNPRANAVLRGVTKRYGRATAVDRLSLEIAAGEFFSILGPSGCGKTTTLRMLAGFIVPDEGEILLAGKSVTRVPPYRRDVNTVFQSYALFQHLDVAGNVAFGLRRRKVPRAEIARRVGRMLELVRLSDRASSKPTELSGGQQQRVALARALVNMPAVLLLDEPLGALDLKLRREMQIELKTIQREVGVTFVFVTHDQEEALTMSDRIAVLNEGVLQQVGAPAEIYNKPANSFVASFIGTSNLLAGAIEDGRVRLLGGVTMELARGGPAAGSAVVVSVRPERIAFGEALTPGCVRLTAEVTDVVFLGATTHVSLELAGGQRLVAITTQVGGRAGAPALRRGDRVEVGWHPQDALVLDGGDARGTDVSSPPTIGADAGGEGASHEQQSAASGAAA